ncbi:microtubule-associated serine/threonine-protein kinase 3-like isoform X2 [Dendrobates tinctorius]|uniref:microtubule-associated serine/threonine-protein kinase 3-like isoform X2 n=1 Tax=Dendrobates tinctorius TaxID=92724 RepID=UPI003CCA342A
MKNKLLTMPKELKRKVLSEEKKGSIVALLAKGYSERHVASILKISKTAVHYNKVKQNTLGTTKLQTGRGRKRLSTDQDDRNLIRMSLSNHRMTSSDLQKEWQMAAGVKCAARTVRNRLLEAGLKSCKARKKPFINEKQRRARLKFAKDHKDWTIADWSKSVIKSLTPAGKPHMRDYEISKLISSGTFGAVYLVRHKDSQQIFAMKKMAKQNLDTPQKVEGAYLERDILIFADCPFVVSMFCSFPTKSHLCMVMEYIGGGDCGTLVSTRGPLSVPLARLYFAEAVLAVEYLHSYGVVHRDLRPKNLLINSAGHIKVSSFGLAKVGLMMPKTNTYKELPENISREFQDCEVCGTLYYIAPEVILKKGYGKPVDWWSMGIILYEFLVGCVPFDEDTLNKLYKNVGDLIWDCDSAPPPDAQDLITMLLRTNPVHRLGTGGACEIKDHPFLSDLDFENLLSQKPEYIPPPVPDVDTSLFIEDEEGTSEDNESLDFLNFTSSSERHAKLCAIATRMNDEAHKSPPDCTPASSTNLSETQEESVSVSNGDNAISSLPSSSPLSEFPAQEEKKISNKSE